MVFMKIQLTCTGFYVFWAIVLPHHETAAIKNLVFETFGIAMPRHTRTVTFRVRAVAMLQTVIRSLGTVLQ